MPAHKVPTTLKLLKGTQRKDRANDREPKPETEGISMPDGLSAGSQKCWKEYFDIVSDMRVMTVADVPALTMMAETADRMILAANELKKGMLVKAPSGYPMQSPYMSILKSERDMLHKLHMQFGITPASRSSVDVSTSNKDKAGGFGQL
jgi:P27 family predicted phage terminase small subunit